MTILKRPMFKLGGSTGEGITSGLKPRQGYASGERVEEIMNLYGTSPKGYNINDFLIQLGLNLASGTPRGNIISTAAHEAKEPFKNLAAGKAGAAKVELGKRMSAVDQALQESLTTQKIEAQERIAGMQLAGKDTPSHIMMLKNLQGRVTNSFNALADEYDKYDSIKKDDPEQWNDMIEETVLWMSTSTASDRNERPQDQWDKSVERWQADVALSINDKEFLKAEFLKNYKPLNPMYRRLKKDKLLWSKDTTKIIDTFDEDDDPNERFFDMGEIEDFQKEHSGAGPTTVADWVSLMKPGMASYEGILFKLPNGTVVKIIKSVDPSFPIDVEELIY